MGMEGVQSLVYQATTNKEGDRRRRGEGWRQRERERKRERERERGYEKEIQRESVPLVWYPHLTVSGLLFPKPFFLSGQNVINQQMKKNVNKRRTNGPSLWATMRAWSIHLSQMMTFHHSLIFLISPMVIEIEKYVIRLTRAYIRMYLLYIKHIFNISLVSNKKHLTKIIERHMYTLDPSKSSLVPSVASTPFWWF